MIFEVYSNFDYETNDSILIGISDWELREIVKESNDRAKKYEEHKMDDGIDI